MKILIIHQHFLEENDGGGSRWNEIARIWTEFGHKVQIIAGMVHPNGYDKKNEYKGKYFVHKKHNKIMVLRCHVSGLYNKNYLGRLWAYFSFMFSSFFGAIFKLKSNYDLILVTSPPIVVGLSGYLISKIKRIPLGKNGT